ncbi:hypothetical protein [Paenibacillus ottowii]
MLRDKVLLALRRLAPAKLEGKDKGNLRSAEQLFFGQLTRDKGNCAIMKRLF